MLSYFLITADLFFDQAEKKQLINRTGQSENTRNRQKRFGECVKGVHKKQWDRLKKKKRKREGAAGRRRV